MNDSNDNSDELQLESFGYKQGFSTIHIDGILLTRALVELKRSFSLFGMIGFAFSVLTWYISLLYFLSNTIALI